MTKIFKRVFSRDSETQSELNEMVKSGLTEWRESILNRVLVIGVLLVFPAAVMTVLRATKYPRELAGAIIILVIYLAVIILSFLRRLNPYFRGWVLVLLLYLTGVVSLARGGLVGDGRIYLIVLPILAIALIGVRSGILMVILGLLTYFVFALFAKFGYLNEWLIIQQNPATLDHWGYDGLVLTALMLTMVILLVSYIQFLMKTLRSEHEITQNLKEAYQIIDQANLQLEEKVDQRTTELAEANEMLLHLATHDPLTSLPNRTVFYDRLTHALAKARRLKSSIVVLFIDLDDFKNVNDTFGHLMGDWLLQEIAKRLLGCVRESDTMARLGGDEFAVILEDLRKLDDVKIVADKIISVVSEEFEIDGQSHQISASVGISVFPMDGENAEDLIRNSDLAMYRVKNSTKNNYEFFSKAVSSASLS